MSETDTETIPGSEIKAINITWYHYVEHDSCDIEIVLKNGRKIVVEAEFCEERSG